MSIRRSLTPVEGMEIDGLPATRRGGGGARKEVSARIRVITGDQPCDAWALNISRGGIRLLIEGRVELGEEILIDPCDSDLQQVLPAEGRGRIVWIQDEPDGAVIGVQFIDAEGHPVQAEPPAPGQASGTPRNT